MIRFRKMVFRVLLALTILWGCSDASNNTAKVKTPSPTDQKTAKDKVKKPKLEWPETGKIKAFFEAYGKENPETHVLLKTRLGNIEIELFEDTPLHRANFIFNIKRGLLHRTIFYRVVPGFMIQGGNSDHDQTLEKREGAGSYYIPSERGKHIHKKGALSMAMSYKDNPQNKSAQYSFFIVMGSRFTEDGLDATEKEYEVSIPEENRVVYKEVGGSPHLDHKHTVFGRVVSGMEVVEAISKEPRDSGDWPVNDVIIEYEVLK